MDSLMQDDFIRTLMDDRELSHKQAVKLWNKHGEEYMETIFEHMDDEINKILIKEKL